MNHRLRWALKDAWAGFKRGLVIGVALILGFSLGWGACVTFISGLDRNVYINTTDFE